MRLNQTEQAQGPYDCSCNETLSSGVLIRLVSKLTPIKWDARIRPFTGFFAERLIAAVSFTD